MSIATAEAPDRVGLCLDCNYDLAGLPVPRCPECGRAFDPADERTFNPGRPIPSYAAWAVGPISGPVELATLVGAGVTLWRARLPGINVSRWWPQMLGWAVLAGIWLMWPVVRRGVLRHYGWPANVIKPMKSRYALVPLVVLAMVAVTARQLPRRWAFDVSRPALDRLAAQVMRTPHVQHPNQRVGVFLAKNIHLLPGGMRFTAEDDDVRFKAGFEYLPRLNPKSAVTFKSYQYMGHGWWAWREEG